MKRTILSMAVSVFTLSVSAQSQEPFPNGGFENWTVYGGGNTSAHPDQFQSLNQSTVTTLQIETCIKATSPSDVHSGSAALALQTFASGLPSPFPAEIQGMVTTGTINTTSYVIEGGMTFVSRPDSIEAWIKYTPAATDTGYIEILLLNANASDTIGRGRFNVTTAVSIYTLFKAPIVYFSSESPAKLRAIINCSSGFTPIPNSLMYVDDARFIYNPVSINEVANVNFSLYPNPSSDKIVLTYNESESATITFTDMAGKLVKRKLIDSKETTLDITSLPEATYLYNIETASGKSTSGHIIIKR